MLLAVETTCDPGGAALAERGRILAERRFAPGEQTGSVLVPAIDALLAEAGIALGQLEAIALAIGPGSFTGLRVGLATVLGLTFAHELPVVPVPTLAALSLEGSGEQLVPLLDARKGQVYTGLYGPDAACLLPDRVTAAGPWFEALRERPGSFFVLGSGVGPHGETARAILGERVRFAADELRGPSPGSVARLGERLLRAGAALPAAQVELRYLRKSEAEEKAPA